MTVARQYDEVLLCETYEKLRASFARFGIDGDKLHGHRRIPGDELGGAWPSEEGESGVFPVVKPEAVVAPSSYVPAGGDSVAPSTAKPTVTYGHATAERSSSVHTLDRTRQLHGRAEEFGAFRTGGRPKYADWRGPLVRERAAATIAVRAAMAERHRQRAKFLRAKARKDGFSAPEIARRRRLAGLVPGAPLTERQLRQHAVGAWHRARASNELAVETVCLGCQVEKTLIVHCGACGSAREAPVRCRRHFFCVGCRSKISEEKRAKLHKAIRVLMRLAWERRLFWKWRERVKGGHWSLKLFTLTAPHAARHDVKARADAFRKALPFFERKLREHVKTIDPENADLVHWSRSAEWEPGDDGKGHPHAHYVFLGPFLDRELACAWWRDALAKAGYDPSESKGHSNFDVRRVRGKGAVGEAIKYVFKDIDGKGKPISAWTFAGAYAALAGRRMTQCSRGFMKLAKVEKKCVDCGATKCFHTRMVDGVRDELRPGLSKARTQAEPLQVGALA